MKYPQLPDYKHLSEQLALYSRLKTEYGARNVGPLLKDAEKLMQRALKKLQALPIDHKLALREPDDLRKIQSLRPMGPRRIWRDFQTEAYRERLEGALLGRFAGCTLGAPVEFWEVKDMEDWAKECGHPFPPTDYWPAITNPHKVRYQVSRRDAYTRDKMDGVPVDDDITYTLLGLLICEDYGPDFSVEDVGKAWLKYLPIACTAEKVALDNLKKGVPARLAGEKDNPYCEWIGADIRSDPWGYLAPAWPEKAAAMAYQDAYLSHRRQGIYGEMYFSAAIAAAFSVDHPVEALKMALSEIPRDCAMAEAVRWALKKAPGLRNYKQAREAMDKQFKGMSGVHTLNNACLTIWGLTLGGTDLTKVISEAVAMGLDNDCTAATAGSICGACIGKKKIPAHWYKRFNNTVLCYLNKRKKFAIDDLVNRFTRQAQRVFA